MENKEYWITPPEIYKALNQEFNFDFDPCPYPYNGIDGTEIDWGMSTYLNPPFRKSDGKNGKGPTAFIRKAIEENKKGKTVVVMINTNAFINMLIEAGAEMRSMGRVKWLDGRTKEPWKSPSNTTCFILRGGKHKNTRPKIDEKEITNKIKPLIKRGFMNMYKSAYEDKTLEGCSYAPNLSSEKEIIKLAQGIVKILKESEE